MTISKQITDHLFRQQSGKMNSILINQFGFEHSSTVEDIIQETFLAALKHWRMKGIPENPEAWLMQVAKNKLINELQRRKRHGKLNKNIVQPADLNLLTENDELIKREQIKAFFACCSPSISSKAQIMLTLKIISGFGDREIAKGLLMSEQSVRKSIYRTRKTLKELGKAAFNIGKGEYIERLDIVLKVLYLMFNEGYYTSSGDKILDEDISFEAIRITTWLLEINYLEHGKIHALLSLMFYNFARFESRTDSSNQIIDIEHQDRSKWDAKFVQQGIYHQRKSRESTEISKYHIESGIAAVHCLSKSYSETDWNQIVLYYQRLLTFDNSFIIEINYAIALSEAGEISASLKLLKGLKRNRMKDSSLLFGALARVYQRKGNLEIAKSYYKVAMDMTLSENERHFFESKLNKLFLNTDGSLN